MTLNDWVVLLIVIVLPVLAFITGGYCARVAADTAVVENVEGHDRHCTIRKCGVSENCNCGAGAGVW